MLSKSKLQYIRSLEHKKLRNAHQAFVAEGSKAVGAMLAAFRCSMLLALPSWIEEHEPLRADEIIPLDHQSLARASFMPSPPSVIAVFRLPTYDRAGINPAEKLVLALDGVQDPGNIGAIVRLADWFGMEHIVCSPDCADAFAPKAVQAAMGSLAAVKVHYTSLPEWLGQMPASINIFGTYPEARSIYRSPLSKAGIIVMGSEGKGLSREVDALITSRIAIPSYGLSPTAAESLNVAMATAIICAEFRRP
jgi:TrmH family RNA methyltransferase